MVVFVYGCIFLGWSVGYNPVFNLIEFYLIKLSSLFISLSINYNYFIEACSNKQIIFNSRIKGITDNLIKIFSDTKTYKNLNKNKNKLKLININLNMLYIQYLILGLANQVLVFISHLINPLFVYIFKGTGKLRVIVNNLFIYFKRLLLKFYAPFELGFKSQAHNILKLSCLGPLIGSTFSKDLKSNEKFSIVQSNEKFNTIITEQPRPTPEMQLPGILNRSCTENRPLAYSRNLASENIHEFFTSNLPLETLVYSVAENSICILIGPAIPYWRLLVLLRFIYKLMNIFNIKLSMVFPRIILFKKSLYISLKSVSEYYLTSSRIYGNLASKLENKLLIKNNYTNTISQSNYPLIQ
jgi:hypothetical protein